MEKKKMGKRIGMSIVGVTLCGISVAFFKFAAFGLDPFQAFMFGLDELVPISFGTLYVIANAVLLLFALIFDRHYIGLATFINLFLLGYIADYTLKLFLFLLPDAPIWMRIVSLLIGIVLICFSLSLYITADLGVSTYDAVALIIVNTWKKGKFQYMRIATDIVCILIGILLHFLAKGFDLFAAKEILSFVSIGTIITAGFMGPLIEWFSVHVSRPFLEGKKTSDAP